MQNIWVISGGRAGRGTTFEYQTSGEAALARAGALESAARQEFEELDERVDLDCTWEEYCEIQDLMPYEVLRVPHVESLNPHDDNIAPTGEVPSGRLWIILEDGRPEEFRGYERTEADAIDSVWSRNWARWEYFIEGGETSFAEFKVNYGGPYDYAPVDPGPAQA